VRNQSIYDIAEICARKGITQVVLCPGSRCAPLTLAFTRHPSLQCRTFSDERSAAFIALGIAQQTKNPVAVVGTSGTAAYNFAPAVAEACFSQTPLLIITADRPAEWIAQHDGQTIYQTELFGKHVKQFYSLPQHHEHPDDRWHINRIINEAINQANSEPKGPVHINAPFREPFYPVPGEPFGYSEEVRILDEQHRICLADTEKESLAVALRAYKNILIVAGQHEGESELTETLQQTAGRVPLVTSVLSNLHRLQHGIHYPDAFLNNLSDDDRLTELKPDLLISFGKSVVSKNLKLFLRKFPALPHWHVQPYPTATDPFQNLTRNIVAHPKDFFQFFNKLSLSLSNQFLENWKVRDQQISRQIKSFFPQPELNELELVCQVLNYLPAACNLHLSNSMSVRYAEYIGLPQHSKANIYSNRGTSGIDGCTSTAVGHSLASGVMNVMITGDLAFFYDRNAFWHNYPLNNLRIVLLNNHGGIIFKLIDGPADLPEADEYFVTRQPLTAKNLCHEFGFDYLPVTSTESLPRLLEDFFKPGGRAKVLELESTIELNKIAFEKFKQKLKQTP
jgi:2-succinyl-5-enolpyruvyl-6-hydroxy-3-cyclohexene-1-carboxylate synthase